VSILSSPFALVTMFVSKINHTPLHQPLKTTHEAGHQGRRKRTI
jgi:hypothetical protein